MHLAGGGGEALIIKESVVRVSPTASPTATSTPVPTVTQNLVNDFSFLGFVFWWWIIVLGIVLLGLAYYWFKFKK